MTSITDPSLSEAMCAVQVQDMDAKIDQAIEHTLGLLRVTITNAALGSELGVVGMISTPIVSRLLCNRIVYGCYELPHSYSLTAEEVLGKIVWSNLAQYMRYAWANFLVLPIGATLMLEVPAAARMMLKCTCDLIIIMDQAFRGSGRALTMDLLKVLFKKYARSKIQLFGQCRCCNLQTSQGACARCSKRDLSDFLGPARAYRQCTYHKTDLCHYICVQGHHLEVQIRWNRGVAPEYKHAIMWEGAAGG